MAKVFPVVLQFARKGLLKNCAEDMVCLGCANAVWYVDQTNPAGGKGAACYCEKLHYLTYGLCPQSKTYRAFIGEGCSGFKEGEGLVDGGLNKR